jgi:hypothetical protein
MQNRPQITARVGDGDKRLYAVDLGGDTFFAVTVADQRRVRALTSFLTGPVC